MIFIKLLDSRYNTSCSGMYWQELNNADPNLHWTCIYFRHTEKVEIMGEEKSVHRDQEPTQEMFQQTGNGSKVGQTAIVPEAILSS
jgi:hypothetical protein